MPDFSLDQVLLVHGLESSEYRRDLLREVWRVLTGDGRLLVIAPNRSGIWAQLERTPLGWGEPYSTGQLSRLLSDNLFIPTRSGRALYIPPIRSHAFLRSVPAWEQIGSCWFPTFGGVVAGRRDRPLVDRPLSACRPRDMLCIEYYSGKIGS